MTKTLHILLSILALVSAGAAYYGWRLLNPPPPEELHTYNEQNDPGMQQILKRLDEKRRESETKAKELKNTSSGVTIGQLDKLSTEEIFNALRDTTDNNTLDAAATLLVRRAHQMDSTGATLIREAFGNAPGSQVFFASLLGQMATKESLGALLDIVKSKEGDYGAVTREIENIGHQGGVYVDDDRDRAVLHAELTSILERELSDAAQDPILLKAVAGGLSTLGRPSGIEALLQTLEELQPREISYVGNLLEGTKIEPRDALVLQITTALAQVRNSEAVPPLAGRLQQDPGLSNPISRIAGDTLVAIGRPKAVDALLQWAANIEGERARQQAITWFNEVYDEQSVNLLVEAGNRYTFRDQEMLTSIIDLALQKKTQL